MALFRSNQEMMLQIFGRPDIWPEPADLDEFGSI